MRRLAAFGFALVWASPALAQSPKSAAGFRPPQALAAIPEESGFDGSFSISYERLFSAANWIGVGGAAYFKNHSNMDFCEGPVLQGYLAVMYHF